MHVIWDEIKWNNQMYDDDECYPCDVWSKNSNRFMTVKLT